VTLRHSVCLIKLAMIFVERFRESIGRTLNSSGNFAWAIIVTSHGDLLFVFGHSISRQMSKHDVITVRSYYAFREQKALHILRILTACSIKV